MEYVTPRPSYAFAVPSVRSAPSASFRQRIASFRAFPVPNPVLLTRLTPCPARPEERMVGTVVNRETLVEKLRNIVGRDAVFSRPADLLVYEYDGSVDGAVETAAPSAVALPTTAQQVAEIVLLARQAGLPVVARGAGTGLSGGAVPQQGGIIISLTRMNRILEIDREDRTALVEPGVINLELSEETLGHGFFFAPDPSSQKACTIGGNVAENSGGPHCLKYGVTTNHILGLEIVLPDGRIVWTGGRSTGHSGYDLTGAMVGSEGMLGIVTKALVRLTPSPEATLVLLAPFADIESASHATSRIIAAGIVPAALEMMDNLTIQAVEPAYHAGYPMDAGAVLLIEIDGVADDVRGTGEEIAAICTRIGRDRSALRNGESRARPPLEGTQDGARRHGTPRSELLPARHGRAALQAAGHAATRRGDLARL